jgi:L-iditol 2-dehydrogenase
MVRACVMTAPDEPVEVRQLPEPTLEPGGVVLRTIYSEVCGTDVHLWHGRLAGVPYPIIPGHVSVGRVEATGGEVRDADGQVLVAGDTVTFLDVHENCYSCWYCLVAKASTRCPKRRVYGITYSASEGLLGGWSEKIYLKPGVRIIRLPPTLGPETFISGGCGLPTAFHAVERATIRLGDTVVVQGTGPVGLCACVFARLSGALNVIAIGAPRLRLDMALEMGADHAISIEDAPASRRVQIVHDLTSGRGADVVIEATGVPAAVAEGLEMVRDAGVYSVAGQYTDAGDVTLNPHRAINKKHVDIRGTWGTDFSHLYRAVQMLNKYRERFPWTEMISRYYGLEQANEALRDVEAGRVVKAVVRPGAG